MSRLIATMVAATSLSVAVFGAAAGAHAQDAPPSGTPPQWGTLVRCAQNPDEAARLACYDGAMRAAGYAPNPVAVEENHRKTFGLSMPKVNVFKHHKTEEGEQASGAAPPPPKENPNSVEATVDQVAIVQPGGRLLVFTSDGQIWEQTDGTVLSSEPEEGSTMLIHRNAIGGYFCDANKYQSVRCKRDK